MPDLHPDLLPLAFLLGTWRGVGVGGYADIEDYQYGQEITFAASDTRPALAYRSHTWWVGEPRDGRSEGSPLAAEVGWWRTQPNSPDRTVVEVTLAHPFGIAEVYVGTVTGTKIDLDQNVVIRTASARRVERSQRLYGLVEDGDLAYAVDMAAEGYDLRPHLSAKLSKV